MPRGKRPAHTVEGSVQHFLSAPTPREYFGHVRARAKGRHPLDLFHDHLDVVPDYESTHDAVGIIMAVDTHGRGWASMASPYCLFIGYDGKECFSIKLTEPLRKPVPDLSEASFILHMFVQHMIRCAKPFFF